MNTAVSLDSFQLIVGLYLLFIAIRGSGTMYNFFDLKDEDRASIVRPLRITYAVCGVIALAEAGLCMWYGNGGSGLSERSFTVITTVLTLLIVLILAAVFIVLRKLAAKK